MPRLIAFYLPQYHPIPENDLWWGKGFTEWTNVAKAKPLFRGHYQPHVPADLGFYDLRVPETRAAQAAMAREHGIEAFCYYHYWFAGKRILERPFNEVLQSGQPDFPFCLCWANQTWTGIWHGCPDRVLIEQTYPGNEDHRAHFHALLPTFLDKRYVSIEGKPLFLIYRPTEIPHVHELVDLWKSMAITAGLPDLYMVAILHNEDSWDPQQHGFDGAVRQYLPMIRKNLGVSWRQPFKKILHSYNDKIGKPTSYPHRNIHLTGHQPRIPGVDNFPCIMPNWDNTPRSGRNGLVLQGSSPDLFRIHLKKALEMVEDLPQERKVILVKSWNEWAEGNHLEPDFLFGTAYLEVIREELRAL